MKMKSGFVFCNLDKQNVLCYTSDRTSVELIPVDSAASLGKAICLSDRTEMRNIQERLRKCDIIDNVYIVNIGSLYKRFL
tara:strand:+ start:1722 stop:1961 length:240 start_codon:yes stop_codon:yes gene_type:complete